MQERTRYRVTGTVFLLALAVIFIPMLFDGEGEPALELPAVDPPARTVEQIQPYDEIVPQSDVVARVSELRAEVDEEGFAADSGTRFGEPVLTPLRPDSDVFAVQAASFARLDNAQRFRGELRDAGYEAFISTHKVSDGALLHRVAVGPLLSDADAEAMQASISEQFAVSAQVVDMAQ